MKGGFYSRGEIEGIVQKIRSPNMDFGAGKVFFVNGFSGSDGYPGDDPEKPLATVTRAHALCVAERGDYILVIRGGADTHPIVIDKARVHLIGVTGKAPQTYAGWTAAEGPLQIAANQVEVAGLTFQADATHPGIEFTAFSWGAWIHHCSFGTVMPTQDGILADVDQEGPVGGLIEDCVFGRSIARDGIRLWAPTRAVIRNNIFRITGAGGIGIHICGPGQFGAILGNVFAGIGGANGEAIRIDNALTVNGLVAGNRAGNLKGVDYGANVPFLDGGTNHWTDNYQNNTVAAIG